MSMQGDDFFSMLNHWQTQQDLHQMKTAELIHEVFSIFDNAESEMLDALIKLLYAVQSSDKQAAQVASLYYGLALAKREARFAVCAACGKNHEEDLHGFFNEGAGDDDA